MNYLCRLCFSNDNLVDVFHPDLEHAERLRNCIFLASGIDIKKDDCISTMVCHRCCEIAVKLHKYRLNAITNDKILKQKGGQPYVPPVTDPNEIMKAALIIDTNVSLENVSLDLLKTNGNDNSSCVTTDTTETIRQNWSRFKAKRDETLNLNRLNNVKPNNSEVLQVSANVSNKHPSVEKLLNKHKNLILPKEVYADDICPTILLDKDDVYEWYSNRSRASKGAINGSTRQSFSSCGISETSDDNEPHIRLRKRSNRRIIIDSDSDDDIFIPKKLPKRSNTISTSVEKPKENVSLPKTQSTSLTTTNSIQKNLKKLFSDFSKYGINFESNDNDTPIETNDTPIETNDTPIETSVEETIPLTVNEDILDVNDDNSDVICLSDDRDTSSATPNIDTEVKSLFENYYRFSCKPKNTAIHYKGKAVITLQNMVSELKKYHIPVEFEYSDANQARFLKRNINDFSSPKTLNLWSYKDCVDIVKPRGDVVVNVTTRADTATIKINTNASTTSVPQDVSSTPINIIYGSLVPSNSLVQPIVLNTTGHTINQGLFTAPIITQAPTVTPLINSNHGIYKVLPVNRNSTNSINATSTNNQSLYVTANTIPSLLPITTSQYQSVSSNTSVSNQTVPITPTSQIQLRFVPKTSVASKLLFQSLTEPKIIRTLLPKANENRTEQITKNINWHRVQNSEPLPPSIPQSSHEAEPKKTDSHLEKLLTIQPGAIRVKNLSELIKS